MDPLVKFNYRINEQWKEEDSDSEGDNDFNLRRGTNELAELKISSSSLLINDDDDDEDGALATPELSPQNYNNHRTQSKHQILF